MGAEKWSFKPGRLLKWTQKEMQTAIWKEESLLDQGVPLWDGTPDTAYHF